MCAQGAIEIGGFSTPIHDHDIPWHDHTCNVKETKQGSIQEYVLV